MNPDWQLLLTRQRNKAQNVSEFHDVTRLYFSNEEVANYNFEKLSALQQPIARGEMHVISSELAKKASSDQ